MKKHFVKIVAASIFLIAAFTVGCDKDKNDDEKVVNVKSVSVTLATLEVEEGASVSTLKANVLPENATNKKVTWISDDPTIAEVNAETGVVKGILAGSTTIWAKCEDGDIASNKCEVTVTKAAEGVRIVGADGEQFTDKKVELVAPQTIELQALLTPERATTSKEVMWNSDNNSIARVQEIDGKYMLVARQAGDAKITVTTLVGNHTDFIDVRVRGVTGISLNIEEIFILIDETITLVATIYPDDDEEIDREVEWDSSNKTVATVDPNGVVTALAVGTTTITVTKIEGDEVFEASCEITVGYPGEGVMVFVEGGSFLMGCTSDNHKPFVNPPDWNGMLGLPPAIGTHPTIGCAANAPERNVTLSSFQIGKYQVTRRQWIAIMKDEEDYIPAVPNMGNPNGPILPADVTPATDDVPINNVSYNDAIIFIEKLNEKTGKNYRLLTEAEWEYAARGGKNPSGDYRYSGSNNINEVAWTQINTDARGLGPYPPAVGGAMPSGFIMPVGLLKPNDLGIHDMSGNVSEWCSDVYNATYYADEPNAVNPQGPETGTGRVHRGGSYGRGIANVNQYNDLSLATRNATSASTRQATNGFRLALDVE